MNTDIIFFGETVKETTKGILAASASVGRAKYVINAGGRLRLPLGSVGKKSLFFVL